MYFWCGRSSYRYTTRDDTKAGLGAQFRIRTCLVNADGNPDLTTSFDDLKTAVGAEGKGRNSCGGAATMPSECYAGPYPGSKLSV